MILVVIVFIFVYNIDMENLEKEIYDLIIVGGGPCGLSASVYAGRSNLKTLVIEEYACGGQILNTYEIKNYPGFENISGPELADKMEKQSKALGVLFKYEKVVDFDFSQKIKIVKTQKNEYLAKAIILSLGASPRKLGLERETELTGKGVSYCAICDGGFFKNKTVAVVGGGNSAMEDAPYLTNLASKTYLINRSEKFRAMQSLVDNMENLRSQGKINLVQNSVVTKLNGENKLESIDVKNTQTGEIQTIAVDGLFIEIGRVPNTNFLADKITLDEYGYIVTDSNLMTSVNGVFAGGDVIKKSLRQIVTASSDGAICATNAQNYLQTFEK